MQKLEAYERQMFASPDLQISLTDPDCRSMATSGRMRMGATHFLMKRLPKVAAEMALCVLAYNLTRVMNIVGMKPLLAAIAA